MSVLSAIGILAVATYGIRLTGVSATRVAALLDRFAAPFTAAVLASLIISGAFSEGDGRLVIDARLAGVAVAGLASLRRLPFLPTLILAVLATAAIRLLFGG